MEIFSTTANQILFLFLLIAIGFGLTKAGVIKDETATILGTLESLLLMPAVILKSLMENCTVTNLAPMGKIVLAGAIAQLGAIAFALLVGRKFSKERFLRNSYIYGFCFSNGGYMGNAVMLALFPNLFFAYIIFTIPMTIATYMWGVPVLLSNEDKKISMKERLKSFVNPMCLSVVIGMVLGMLEVPVPLAVGNTISALADCMSPIAMLLIGIAVANAGFKKIFTIPRTYVATLFRLLVMPLLVIGVLYLMKPSEDIAILSACWMAMPVGLNPLIMASAYERDTTENAGLVIVSHLLSFLTIPLIITIIETCV